MKFFAKIAVCLLLSIAGVAASTTTLSAQSNEDKVIAVDGRNYYIYTISAGDTYYSLSRKYGVTEQDIRQSNPRVDVLRTGETIKIPCRELPEEKMSARKRARQFTDHVVKQGETTYSIARSYSMSVDALVADNPGLDPSHLAIGQVLSIRNAEKGGASFSEIDEQIADYARTMNQHSDDYIYHNVVLGETIFSLSRRFGVPESAITDNNDLAAGLKVGMIIRIPSDKSNVPATSEADEAVVVLDENPADLPQPGEEGYGDPMWGFEPEIGDGLEVADLGGRIKISMLLPLTNASGAVRNIFAEFYQGALLALDRLKGEGYSASLDLFDTRDDSLRVAEIVEKEAFRESNLVIGPVYERNLNPVLEYAERAQIPVVSPLAAVESATSPYLFQLSPDAEQKSNGVAELFTEDKNIVFITSGQTDTEFENEMKRLAEGKSYRTFAYNKELLHDLDSLYFAPDMENMFVVLPRREMDVDLVLAALSSIQNNRVARSIRTGNIRVVGSSRWTGYEALDRNLFFKLNASLVASYFVDPTSERVKQFDKSYIKAYSNLPTLYSYRGYDAVMLFAEAMLSGGGDLAVRLNTTTPTLVPYHFEPLGGVYRNMHWNFIQYKDDYTISLK